MIPKRKQYYFNEKSLKYEPVGLGIGDKILMFFKFLGITSLFAGLITLIFSAFVGSPVEIIMQSKITELTTNYLTINKEIDNLHYQLHEKIFIADRYYREILELDSVPAPIRFAGTGGAEADYGIYNSISQNLISITTKKIDALKRQIFFQYESFNTIFDSAVFFNRELREIPAIPPVKPCQSIWISSEYGSRFDPFTSESRAHAGIDFVGPINTPIFATADGTVTLAEDSRTGYGNEVVISHSFGYSTRYAHLNSISVKDGQKVQRGQLIGHMGSTGRSTGTHLHYEVRLKNMPVNPIYYFVDNLLEKEYALIVEQTTELTK